jgi:HAMP domain-containing protein
MDAALAVAIAACVVAVIALAASLLLARRLRRLQSGQKAVLGGASHDMVEFAVSLQARIDDLHRAVGSSRRRSPSSTRPEREPS